MIWSSPYLLRKYIMIGWVSFFGLLCSNSRLPVRAEELHRRSMYTMFDGTGYVTCVCCFGESCYHSWRFFFRQRVQSTTRAVTSQLDIVALLFNRLCKLLSKGRWTEKHRRWLDRSWFCVMEADWWVYYWHFKIVKAWRFPGVPGATLANPRHCSVYPRLLIGSSTLTF